MYTDPDAEPDLSHSFSIDASLHAVGSSYVNRNMGHGDKLTHNLEPAVGHEKEMKACNMTKFEKILLGLALDNGEADSVLSLELTQNMQH